MEKKKLLCLRIYCEGWSCTTRWHTALSCFIIVFMPYVAIFCWAYKQYNLELLPDILSNLATNQCPCRAARNATNQCFSCFAAK